MIKKQVRILIAIIVILFSMIGCTYDFSHPTRTQKKEVDENDSIALEENVEDDAIPLETYLGIDYKQLTKFQIEKVNRIYNQMAHYDGDFVRSKLDL